MTVDDFRRIALGIPGALESTHMAHPDFRVRGRIFATLAYPTQAWGMVKLTPEQQRAFVLAAPSAFVPVKGAWGEKGATSVRLAAAPEELVHEALLAASGNIPDGRRKTPVKKTPRKSQSKKAAPRR